MDDSAAVAHGVSEPERNRALVRLRDRYAADELSIEEFSYELDAVLAARTQAQVQRASPDLPSAPASDLSWSDAESLQHHLPAGEAVVWTGRPDAGISLPTGRGRVVVVGIWLVAGVVNLTSAGSVGAVVAGVLFASAVLGFAYRRFVFTEGSRRRVLYVVTTARIARVVRNRAGEQMDSILLQAIPAISVRTGTRGRGTISFGQPAPTPTFAIGASTTSRRRDESALSFANLPDAVHVARLISSLQAHQANPRQRATVNRPTGPHLKKH